jgi:ABC-type lipoprotein release transport system permease subunit
MALGAQVRDILALILSNGLRMAVIGSIIGAIGALFLSRVITRSLPAFSGAYVLPIVVASGVLLLVALIACLLPAHRASRISPTEALRAE